MDYKEKIISALTESLGFNPGSVGAYLEQPPQEEWGDYAFPCFKLAKELKKAPNQIATELGAYLQEQGLVERYEIKGAYLNLFLAKENFLLDLLRALLADPKLWCSSRSGQGKRVIIEYSSPNIAKPFHVGHAFSTTLGEALARMYVAANYKVFRFNHLGDYGTQFGKLIVAWKRWGDEEALQKEPIKELTRVYVLFHKTAETDLELEQEAREAFKNLEAGASTETELWEKFRSLSLEEFERLYQRLNIKFDNYNGESFYSPLIPDVVKQLKEQNLLHESQGAQVVPLDEYKLTPCIILKSDGTTIYASRDLAAIRYRKKEYDFDKNIYVVGKEQSYHFAQVFAVLDKAEWPSAGKCEHVPFGRVKFAEGDFSTRKGNVILLEDLLNEAVAKTRAIIAENNSDLAEAEQALIAEKLGLAAVRYIFLKNGRERDIFFDWQAMLDFEGDSAPYLLYTYARARSVLRKAEHSYDKARLKEYVATLKEADAYRVLKDIYQLPERLEQALQQEEPSVLARAIYELARDFNKFYHNQPILKAENTLTLEARLLLCEIFSAQIQQALYLLGIETVERM